MKTKHSALLQGITAFLIWGFFPVYFKILTTVPPLEIALYRMILSFPVMLLFLLLWLGPMSVWRQVKASLKILPILLLTGGLMSFNWLVFVWAIAADKIIETSLGYFTSPILTIFFSLLFLKEKLSRLKKIALIIAFCSVTIRIIHYGQLPIIALSLAGSFSLYALLKKIFQQPSLRPSLLFLIESALMLPIACIIFLTIVEAPVLFANSATSSIKSFVLALGIVSVVPLVLFNQAVQKTDLTRMGFLQYLSPSISFLLAISVYQEPFTVFDFMVFSFIWIALFLIGFDDYTLYQRLRLRLVAIPKRTP